MYNVNELTLNFLCDALTFGAYNDDVVLSRINVVLAEMGV